MTLVTLLLALLLGLIPTFLFVRPFYSVRRRFINDKSMLSEGRRLKHNDRYWGVQLMPPQFGICCSQLRQLQGRTFPKARAPALPLKGCAVSHCHCRYHYLVERRSGQDRRREHRLVAGESDRRSGEDRRQAY